jgi:hypothetical protein
VDIQIGIYQTAVNQGLLYIICHTIKVKSGFFYLFKFEFVPNLWSPVPLYYDYILGGNFKLLAAYVHNSKQAPLSLLLQLLVNFGDDLCQQQKLG